MKDLGMDESLTIDYFMDMKIFNRDMILFSTVIVCLTWDQYTALSNDQNVLSLELFGILTPLGLLDYKRSVDIYKLYVSATINKTSCQNT